MNIRQQKVPTPPEIMEIPELATIAVLDMMLEVAWMTVVASDQKAIDDDLPYWIEIELRQSTLQARKVLPLMAKLQRALQKYSAALVMEAEKRSADNCPDDEVELDF